MVTGAADSVITIWKDCTEEKETEKRSAAEQVVLRYFFYVSLKISFMSDIDIHEREQDYLNFVALKDYRSAISLALALDHPGRLLKLFKEVLFTRPEPLPLGAKQAESLIDDILKTLPSAELINLFRHVRDWNSNAKTSPVAQAILHALLRLRRVEELTRAFKETEPLSSAGTVKASDKSLSFSELVKALIPYTERHLARIDRLVQESYVLDYVLGEMDGGILTDGDVMDIDG